MTEPMTITVLIFGRMISVLVSGENDFMLTSQGRVGIGTTSPQRMLGVGGGASFLEGSGYAMYLDDFVIGGVSGPSMQIAGSGSTLSIRPYGAGSYPHQSEWSG